MPTKVIGEHTIVDGRFLVLLVASSVTVSILDVTFWVTTIPDVTSVTQSIV